MRPLELRLRNFRSYAGGETTFDFRDRTLLGVVGAIGSGKSSILDAIAFALYGRTPSIAAATKSLIHQRSDETAVALRFEVEDTVYEVVRSLRRKGASQHALYRYDADVADAEPVATVTQEAEVNAAIVELLGLEFDVFSRSVLLAQGRFAEFLSARPSERDKVLKGVFGHDRIDRMRELAKDRAADARVERAGLEARVEKAESLAAEQERQRGQLEAAKQRLEALSKVEPRVVDLEERVSEAATARREAHAQLEVLATHRDRVPGETVSDALLDEVSRAKTQRREAAALLDTASGTLVAAEAAVKAAEKEGVPATIEAATVLLAALAPVERSVQEAEARVRRFEERLERSRTEAATAEERQRTAVRAVARTGSEAVAASQAADDAEAELHAARHQDMAASLRAELHAGEPCPVCRQVVATPPTGPGVELEKYEHRLEVTRARRESAARAAARALADQASAEEALQQSRDGAEAAASELAAASDDLRSRADERHRQAAQLTDILGPGDPDQLLGELRARQATLVEAAATARKEVDRARARHDAAIRAEQDAEKQLGVLRLDAMELAGKIGEELEPPTDDPESVGRALVDLRARWQELTTEMSEIQSAAKAEEKEARTEIDRLLASLDAEPPLAAALAAAETRVELLAAGLATIEEALDASAGAVAARDATAAQVARYERLASDLTNSRFVRYLLDDERSRLAELGSEHFERLSSGRYRFTDDGGFEIVDLTAADAVRKADSLSGGETFLASLALALALAEMVTRTGGRLDAFFLDEGFGALDPEHLDLAMEGVEALAAEESDRLVLVVSHVPELRHRLEDLIILDRDPTTGDTRVIQA